MEAVGPLEVLHPGHPLERVVGGDVLALEVVHVAVGELHPEPVLAQGRGVAGLGSPGRDQGGVDRPVAAVGHQHLLGDAHVEPGAGPVVALGGALRPRRRLGEGHVPAADEGAVLQLDPAAIGLLHVEHLPPTGAAHHRATAAAVDAGAGPAGEGDVQGLALVDAHPSEVAAPRGPHLAGLDVELPPRAYEGDPVVDGAAVEDHPEALPQRRVVLVGEVVAGVGVGAGAIDGDEGVVVGQQRAGRDARVSLAARALAGEPNVAIAEVGPAAHLDPDARAARPAKPRSDGHPGALGEGPEPLGAAPGLGEERGVRVDDLRAPGTAGRRW